MLPVSGHVDPVASDATHKGVDTYEVVWSVEVTTSRDLRKPKVEEIRHAGIVWQKRSGGE